MDQYLSILEESTAEITEKKSKFIGHIKPVTSESQANEYLRNIRERYWDARHNVYAYALKTNFKSKASDDGEPHGTAGIPILEVIKKNNLFDVMIIVTRYFGGILLGTGGLTRAYSQCASLAIQNAKTVNYKLCSCFELFCNYDQLNKIKNIICTSHAKIDGTIFLENVKVNFHVPSQDADLLKKKLLEVTCGHSNLKFIEEKFLY